ncbi:hypothetical protein J4401_02390 [Candidatus Woesearchaeota archaeon]|nr:hypothetical protein [Candidatus Woesearchaeota archaeon]
MHNNMNIHETSMKVKGSIFSTSGRRGIGLREPIRDIYLSRLNHLT